MVAEGLTHDGVETGAAVARLAPEGPHDIFWHAADGQLSHDITSCEPGQHPKASDASTSEAMPQALYIRGCRQTR